MLAAGVVVGLALWQRPRPPQGLTKAPAAVVAAAAVTRGRVAQSITLSGTLQPVQRVELSAQVPAKVSAVYVKEGDSVPAGAVLARFDEREMRANVDKAAAGIRAAAAQVTKARVGAEMTRSLADVRVDRAMDGIKAADAQVSGARAGAEVSEASAKAQVSQALSGIEAAEAAVLQAEKGAALSRQQADSDIATAQGGLAAAEADLKRATSGASVGSDAAAADVERARAGVATAEANLARVKAGARTSDVEAAEAQVKQARIGRDAAKRAVDDLTYLRKNGGVAGADLQQAQTQLDICNAQVDAAEAQLRGARAGASAEEVAAAEGQLREARAGLKQAEAGQGRSSVSAAEIEAARANVDRARTGLQSAEKAKAERYGLAEAQVRAARAAVEQARAGHGAAVSGLGVGKVRQAEVAAAQGNLAQAGGGLREAQVGRREAEVRAADLAAAQAGLLAAQADYRLAAEQIAKCQLVSPVAGQVTKLALHAGDAVMPGMPLAAVETKAAAELVCLVSGDQRAQLRAGQPARVKVDGSKREFTATVREVATSAEADGRTFRVRLLVAGDGLLPGARATCEVDVAVDDAALCVPLPAVQDVDGEAPHVFVTQAGRAVRRPVTLGLRSTATAQVVEGLAEGDLVVVSGAENLHDGSAVDTR